MAERLRCLFRGCGEIAFLRSGAAGLVLAATMLLRPGMAMTGLIALAAGYAVGVSVQAFLFRPWSQCLADYHGFNFILVSMAAGGVFLIPSGRGFLLAMIGAAVVPLLIEACSALGGPWGIPPFTLPFCLTAVVVVCVLRLVQHPLLSAGYGRNPEEIRENSLVNGFRYRGDNRTLYLPFAGAWTVLQAFVGPWTHRGIWRHAYDFVIVDDRGMMHRGDGGALHDYYCYRLPVLSPVRGHVVRVVDHLPENPVGGVDGGNNWGNLVMLRDPRGFHVEISHLALKSIRVREGDWVERGAILGLCGNSGYSPRPHIHVQVQANDASGAGAVGALASVVEDFAGWASAANEKGDLSSSDARATVAANRHAIPTASSPVLRRKGTGVARLTECPSAMLWNGDDFMIRSQPCPQAQFARRPLEGPEGSVVGQNSPAVAICRFPCDNPSEGCKRLDGCVGWADLQEKTWLTVVCEAICIPSPCLLSSLSNRRVSRPLEATVQGANGLGTGCGGSLRISCCSMLGPACGSRWAELALDGTNRCAIEGLVRKRGQALRQGDSLGGILGESARSRPPFLNHAPLN